MRTKVNPFIALQYRDFRLLWFGLFISQVGSQMQIVAIDWHIYTLTKSPIALGLLGLVGFLSIIVFSLVGGIVADRYNRKHLMIFSQIVLGCTALGLALTTYFEIISPLLIYGAIAINSAVNSFDLPARQSLMPTLVPKTHFIHAVSIMSVMRQTALVVGFSASGFIIALYGVDYIYFFNALTFIASILTVVLIQAKPPPVEQRPTFSWSSINQGIQFVKRTPLIHSTMILDFFATFFASATVLLPIYAQDILQVGPQGLGFLYAAGPVGSMFAALLLSSVGQVRAQGKLLISGVLLYAIATVGFGFTHTLLPALCCLALIGAGDMVSTIIRNIIRQLATPDHLRGRMVSINMVFFAGGPKLGETEAGFAAALLGTPGSVIIGGLGTIIATLAVVRWRPQIWHYKGDEVAE